MGIKLSLFATRQLPVVTANFAGEVIVNDYFVDLEAGDLDLNDTVDLGILPAYHTVVDGILIPDELDSNGAPALILDAGIMSGEPGQNDAARTVGTELFAASTAGQDGAVTRLSAKGAFLIKPVAYDRSIGVKIAAAPATKAPGRLRLRTFMTAASDNLQF